MKSAVLILCGLLALARGRTIESDALYNPRIINGEEAKLGERPYQVSLQRDGLHRCSGSVVNDRWVVTAAHCAGHPPAIIKVVVGTISLEKPFRTHQAEHIIIHDKYTPGDSYRNDIALIKVASPFTFGKEVQPVALPKLHSKVKTNSTAVASGWGQLLNGTRPDKLQKVSIYIANPEYCSEVMEEVNMKIHPTHVCANDPFMRKGVCFGDSGGPLTVDNVLTGIASWVITDPYCGSTKFPGVFTRVSEFVDWIDERIH